MGGELIAEHEGLTATPSTPSKEYVYGPTGMLAEVTSSEVNYLTPDHLGSPRVLTSQNGIVVNRRDFFPFGEDIAVGVGGRSAGMGYGTDTLRQKFTGYERDEETGLDFAQARYYANALGRFMSSDPVVITGERMIDPQRINLYAYCRGNPLSFIDPTGAVVEFADKRARKKYEEYKAFLNKDPKKYKDLIATVQQLENSDVTFVVALGGSSTFSGGTEGNVISPDGETVNVNIGNVGGPSGEQYSINSRFAHELEHARQFDSGEFAFVYDSNGNPVGYTGLDIMDEVNAFQAQLTASIPTDFTVLGGSKHKEFQFRVLDSFAKAETNEEKAQTIAKLGNTYKESYARGGFGSNFTLKGVQPGTLVRPSDRTVDVKNQRNEPLRLFGRTHR